MTSSEHEFAVVDVETTGFGKNDRVIEFAAIRIGSDGRSIDEYVTLINPCRDVGPTRKHGIRARDVQHAPQFREIAGDVTSILAGAVFVAHNASFDMRMLRQEFERLHHELPIFPFLCTMRLARRMDGNVGRLALESVCKRFQIRLVEAHSAEADARATCEILSLGLKRLPGKGSVFERLGVTGEPLQRDQWPGLPKRGLCLTRAHANRVKDPGSVRMAQLLASLPSVSDGTVESYEYLDLLDRILEDRCVDDDEAQALYEVACALGIGKERTVRLHEEYVRGLVGVAVSDGILTEFEREDLADVCRLLGVSKEGALRFAQESLHDHSGVPGTIPRSPVQCDGLAGKTVCFTGQFRLSIGEEVISRTQVERMATERGILVQKAVTKRLDILVVADPESSSGKAVKARKYGVRVIAEPVFWQMMGVQAAEFGVCGEAFGAPSMRISSEQRLPPEVPTIARRTRASRKRAAASVNIRQSKSEAVEDLPCAGKTVVVTGTLESMGRKEAQELIKRLGGKVSSSVSKKTDFVVYGDSPGPKLEKARQLGVETLDEKAFLELIGRT